VRRPHLLTAGASALATVALVGCLDGTANGTESTDRAPDSGVVTGEIETTQATPAAAEATPDETTVHPIDTPDPDHDIWVENETERTRRLRVTVTHHVEDGQDELVHESTHELAPKGSKYVYNLSEANPDGVERFEVFGESGDQTTSRFMATSECYLDCGIVLRERGELVVERPIC
jgi:hypothetical protein